MGRYALKEHFQVFLFTNLLFSKKNLHYKIFSLDFKFYVFEENNNKNFFI